MYKNSSVNVVRHISHRICFFVMRNLLHLFFISAAFLSIHACSSNKKVQNGNSGNGSSLHKPQTIVPDTFLLPDIPVAITNSNARAVYLVTHYWDRFDFSDESLILRPEITEQALVDYINILAYVPVEKAKESLKQTQRKAAVNKSMYLHLGTLFDKYLYNADSPLRNEQLYIPVLKGLIKSDYLSESEKSKYRFQLEMVLKNQIGRTAADFSYTLASGQTLRMHAIRSEYLLLIFSNPECTTCMTVMDALKKSPGLNRAFSINSPTRTMIAILTVYPDAGVEAWRKRLPQLPPTWIHSYDNGMIIKKQKLYDLKAIPTLYLLDKDKKVVLKDTSIEAIEAFFGAPN